MKRITFHDIECDGKFVDFEVHDDGGVVVVGHDIEIDEAKYALGFRPSGCMLSYLMLKNDPIDFLHREGFVPKSYRGVELMLRVPWSVIEEDWGLIRDNRTDLVYTEARNGAWVYLSVRKDPENPNELRGALSYELRQTLKKAWTKGILDVYFDPDID
jgi:hypothetical protein